MRAARSAISDATASNFLTKYASASSALFPGYEPTALSPVEVFTKTVPSGATYPNLAGSPMSADAAEVGIEIDVGVMSDMVFPSAR